MGAEDMKKAVAQAALRHLPRGRVIGVGTGSTVNHFIDALAGMRDDIPAAVSSSEASTERLKGIGITVEDLNAVDEIAVYVDGADEINRLLQMIKGGGGALTREKVVAAVSRQFICIADESKLVGSLGAFPLPVEVIPMARSHVARRLVVLGGRPVLREGFITDNGNQILDVHGLRIQEPIALEERINNIAGVVTNGLFAARGADLLLLGAPEGVREITRQ